MKHRYDATGVDPLSGFALIAEGNYRLVITAAEEKTTTTGRNMVNLTCEVVDGQPFAGSKVWHNVTEIPKGEKGAGFMLHFLHAIAEPYSGVFEWDPEIWIGKIFLAEIVHQIGTDNVKRAKVGKVLLPDEAPASSSKKTDDDCPF